MHKKLIKLHFSKKKIFGGYDLIVYCLKMANNKDTQKFKRNAYKNCCIMHHSFSLVLFKSEEIMHRENNGDKLKVMPKKQ